MGTWGYGPFENDVASDWIECEFNGSDESLSMALEGMCFEEQIAAAAVIVSLRGHPPEGGTTERIRELARRAPVPEPLVLLAREKLSALLHDPEFLELMGEEDGPGEFCESVQDLLEKLSLAPKAPGLAAVNGPSPNAGDMKALEKKAWDIALKHAEENIRRDAGSDGDVTPAAGDLIGIPLAGGDFALAVLLSTGVLDDLENMPDFFTGLMAITDKKQSQAEEPEVTDPGDLNFVDARSVLMGPVRLGEWPVICSGIPVRPIQQDLESRSGVALSSLLDSFEGAIVLQDYVNHLHGRPTSFAGPSYGNLFD